MPEEFQRKIKMINNFYTTYFQITFNNKIPLYDNFHSLIRTSKKFKKLFLTILDIPVKKSQMTWSTNPWMILAPRKRKERERNSP